MATEVIVAGVSGPISTVHAAIQWRRTAHMLSSRVRGKPERWSVRAGSDESEPSMCAREEKFIYGDEN